MPARIQLHTALTHMHATPHSPPRRHAHTRTYVRETSYKRTKFRHFKGECSVFKKNIMDENDALSEYNKIPLGQIRTNGAFTPKSTSKL